MEKLKKFFNKFVSPDLPLRLNIFNIMTVIGIFGGVVSIIITYMMNIKNGQIWAMVIAIFMLVFLLHLANAKKKLNLASMLLCVVIGFGLFPPMFLNGGGIYSGMPLWFILVIVLRQY